MDTRELLAEKREDILRIAAQHGALNVRLFSSVARGKRGQTATSTSYSRLHWAQFVLSWWAGRRPRRVARSARRCRRTRGITLVRTNTIAN